MYFLIEDDDLLEKYSTIWDSIKIVTKRNLIASKRNSIKEEFDSKPVYHIIFLKTKIKSHSDEVTDFYDKEIPNVDSNHTYLAVITLDSALKKDDNYCPQVFLKVCKHIEKKLEKLGIFMIISVIFLLMMMSLMKNKLERVKFFCKSYYS